MGSSTIERLSPYTNPVFGYHLNRIIECLQGNRNGVITVTDSNGNATILNGVIQSPLTGPITVNGNLTTTGVLTSSGISNTGTLTQTGDVSITGNETVSGLTVNGNETISGGVLTVPIGGVLVTLAGAAGAPTSGAYSAGQIYTDSKGALWVCTTSGTPGTWRYAGGGTYHAEVYQNSVQSITSNSWTVVAFDTVESDPNNNITTGASFHYTAPLAGRYSIASLFSWGANVSAFPSIALYKNGSEVRRGFQSNSGATIFTNPLSTVISCAASDTLDIRVFQNSGGSINSSPGSNTVWAQFTFIGS